MRPINPSQNLYFPPRGIGGLLGLMISSADTLGFLSAIVQPPPALVAFHNQIRKMMDSSFSASDPAIHPQIIP